MKQLARYGTVGALNGFVWNRRWTFAATA